MNSDQHTRAENAISDDMEIEHLGDDEYRVKDYDVNPVEGTCSCPDHEYRGYQCKHILRTALEIQWGNIPEPGTEERATRPNPLQPLYDRVPDTLTAMNHWVCWANQRDSDPSHEKDWTKVPIDVNDGGFASSTDPDTWTTFEEARHYDEDDTERTDGVGFVVSEDDPIIGIDIDDCRDPDTGELVDGVKGIADRVGSYMEVSPSGTGLRIFVKGDWPIGENQSDRISGGGVSLEVYEWGRYLTVTGYHIDGTPPDITDDQDTIDHFAEIIDPSYGLEAE
jgi:hypothetical protein